MGSKRRKSYGDGFLLLGDAAGLIDPFTGEPLRLGRTEDGRPVVYSVGIDFDDDGGAPRPRRARFDDTDGDISLVLPVE